ICYKDLTKSIIKNDVQFKKYKRRKNAGLKKARYSVLLKLMRECGYSDFPERQANCWGQQGQIIQIIDSEIVAYMTEQKLKHDTKFRETLPHIKEYLKNNGEPNVSQEQALARTWKFLQFFEIQNFFKESTERR